MCRFVPWMGAIRGLVMSVGAKMHGTITWNGMGITQRLPYCFSLVRENNPHHFISPHLPRVCDISCAVFWIGELIRALRTQLERNEKLMIEMFITIKLIERWTFFLLVIQNKVVLNPCLLPYLFMFLTTGCSFFLLYLRTSSSFIHPRLSFFCTLSRLSHVGSHNMPHYLASLPLLDASYLLLSPWDAHMRGLWSHFAPHRAPRIQTLSIPRALSLTLTDEIAWIMERAVLLLPLYYSHIRPHLFTYTHKFLKTSVNNNCCLFSCPAFVHIPPTQNYTVNTTPPSLIESGDFYCVNWFPICNSTKPIHRRPVIVFATRVTNRGMKRGVPTFFHSTSECTTTGEVVLHRPFAPVWHSRLSPIRWSSMMVRDAKPVIVQFEQHVYVPPAVEYFYVYYPSHSSKSIPFYSHYQPHSYSGLPCNGPKQRTSRSYKVFLSATLWYCNS